MLFIFDENFPPQFVQGFSILEQANKRTSVPVHIVFSVDFMGGHKIDPSTGNTESISDEEIIIKASRQQAVIFTHDSDFKRIKHYKPLLAQHQVGYVYFKTPKKYNYWDIVKAFVNKWEDIKQIALTTTHPFAFEVSKSGNIMQLQF